MRQRKFTRGRPRRTSSLLFMWVAWASQRQHEPANWSVEVWPILEGSLARLARGVLKHAPRQPERLHR
ncbi:MAG TPA: hypothetical protein VHX16_00180, partial [Chloroflexota bacterium]|nr:hypothetical protein [Chloroflexota bacterium]